MTSLFNSGTEKALLIAEPRSATYESEIQIIALGSVKKVYYLHSNYWRLFKSDNQVLNVYLDSEFKHPCRDWRWMMRQESLRYEHLYEALKQSVTREQELFGISF